MPLAVCVCGGRVTVSVTADMRERQKRTKKSVSVMFSSVLM